MNSTLKHRLIDKSEEAFLMAIEIYNKPTIRYRVEGFSMFICNAWELMLKAYMIEMFGESSIYFNDNPERSLSLTDCIKKIFTNDKDPMRLNLEKIVELRNTSTHLIVEEYEMVYVPLFQSCIINFNDKMLEFHDIDMTEIVPQNFLTLSVSLKALDENEIKAKYSDIISNKLFSFKNNIELLESTENQKFAITINVNHYLTKNRKEADAIYHLAKDGEEPIALMKEVKDSDLVYRYSTKQALETISTMLKRNKINLLYNGTVTEFNMYHFNNFIKYFGMKQNETFCKSTTIGDTTFYKYSQQNLDFIATELKKDPNNLLDRIKQKKR